MARASSESMRGVSKSSESLAAAHQMNAPASKITGAGSVVSRAASAAKWAAAAANSPAYSVSSPARSSGRPRDSPGGGTVVCSRRTVVTSSGAGTSACRGGADQLDDAPRDGAQRLGGGRLRLRDDDGPAGVGEIGHPGLEGHLAEEWHAQLLGEALPAAGREQLR